MTDYQTKSIEAHRINRGKLTVESKLPVTNREELSIAYTPGVAGPCLVIAKDASAAYDLTATKNGVAIVSDGTAVLGLGDIGPEAALPVMEGKAVLFKRFAGLDGFPIVLGTKDTEEIIAAVKAIAPTFGGINLEDISAPRCFEIEERLKAELSIPVMHDDQHGTAIVVLAGLINAMKVTNKHLNDCKVVLNGAGAAGIAIIRLIKRYAPHVTIVALDSLGIISTDRTDLTNSKLRLMEEHIIDGSSAGDLTHALTNADIFIGVSKANTLTEVMVKKMKPKPIIFAMANPNPEIMPDLAKKAGVFVIATGRSDFPNQVNNVLAYPGIFKGAIRSRLKKITEEMKLAAAEALAQMVEPPTPEKIIPDPFEPNIAEHVAQAVENAASK
jgi:malate dehydrogenase (oxaloacetate-decarboxylating)